MKNSIGKPYEGKLHVRFDEGGADSLLIIITFNVNNESGLSGSTLQKIKPILLLNTTNFIMVNYSEKILIGHKLK